MSADQPVRQLAIVGAGPSGCYTAQALRRALPDARIAVFDRLPVPYGLIRHGVAADHQGTKAISRQFARLFEREGVAFVGNVRVGSEPSLDELRGAFDAVVLAQGMHEDARLPIPGGDFERVIGSGRLTRLLNGHPGERRPAPRLGRSIAVVGTGNVAIDLIRLLAKRPEDLAGSDVDDEAHRLLVADLTRIAVIGRSLPDQARCDPAMIRELGTLAGVSHVIRGAARTELLAGGPRSRAFAELPEGTGSRISVEWWFGYAPERVLGAEDVAGIRLRSVAGDARAELPVEAVVTAIGFGSAPEQRLAEVSAEARETGCVEEGLYLAGWARRGPRGTIPDQRAEARALAERIVRDLGHRAHRGRGLESLLPELPGATDYAGWLRIDAREQEEAPPERCRRKIVDAESLLRVARP